VIKPKTHRTKLEPSNVNVRIKLSALAFLLGTTAYIVIPSLMVFLSLILRPRVNRIANIALSVLYALTIIAGAIGEWNYYILGSAIEVMALAAIVYYAWTWPTEAPPTSMT